MYLLALALIAAAFDSSMSIEEQRKTGLAKLTAKEKMALESWIDARYSKKEVAQNAPAPAPAPVKKQPALLEENLNNGRFIRLSDKSLWEIDPTDTPITQGWITSVEIKIQPVGGSAAYPYVLTNSLTGSAVKGRPAQSATVSKPGT